MKYQMSFRAKTWYRKIPKIIPGAYIFQRPFSRGLFLEGLIFGGAYVRREICVSKSIGLALFLEGNLPFFFVLPCIWGQFPSTSPRGAYIWRGVLTERFLRYEFGGLIFGGAYTWRGLFSEFYGSRFKFHTLNGEEDESEGTIVSWTEIVFIHGSRHTGSTPSFLSL